MEQLPFEAPSGGAAAVRRLSLVRLASEIARALGAIGRVAVEGEVVNPRSHPGGVYFTLKDRAAQLSVRCPAGKAAQWRIVAGERVVVAGVAQWLNERGQVQFVADEVAPVGVGAIAAAVADRRARLAADGLLDRPRRPIPVLPVVIGVVCGTEAAVRADIESVVASRFPGYPVTFAQTNVSGAGAAEAIVAALRGLDARADVEVIILARGGGDAAQLLPFSDEGLCRAICACATPVVSAVGHDGDRPLCDEVADLRCGTPSIAAAQVVPDRAVLLATLDRLHEQRKAALGEAGQRAAARLAAIDREGAVQAGLGVAGDRLARAGAALRLVHPARLVAAAAGRLHRVEWRGPAARRCRAEGARLAAAARTLEALSPARVLARGYAVVRDERGAVVRTAAGVDTGARLDVELAAGRLAVRVEEARP